MCDKAKIVSRLLAAKDTPFVKEDEARLLEFSDAQLQVQLKALGESDDPGEKGKEETPPPAEPKQLSEAEWLAQAPAGVRSLVERSQREEEARRASMITALAGAQKRKDEKALAAMSTEDLADLYAMLELGEPERDFSGRGLPSEPTALANGSAPDPYAMDKIVGSARSAN